MAYINHSYVLRVSDILPVGFFLFLYPVPWLIQEMLNCSVVAEMFAKKSSLTSIIHQMDFR